jgi:hypothetical protein
MKSSIDVTPLEDTTKSSLQSPKIDNINAVDAPINEVGAPPSLFNLG